MPSEVSVSQKVYKGWDATIVARPPLELVMVPQVGGRIMGMRWRDREFFFTQPEREGTVEDVSRIDDVHDRKREMGFPLWGGDKTWIGPQGEWTDGVPFLDLDSGSYDLAVVEDSPERAVILMTSPVCRETGVRITRTVDVRRGEKGWGLTHIVENRSNEQVRWAPWDVAMCLRPGHVYLPVRAGSLYADGIKTFESEGRAVQVRDAVVHRDGDHAVVDCTGLDAFKYGTDSPEGWIFAVLGSAADYYLGYYKQVRVPARTTYPHGCSAEVYNSDRYPYLEMEILGPLVTLDPGALVTLEGRDTVVELDGLPATEKDLSEILQICRS